MARSVRQRVNPRHPGQQERGSAGGHGAPRAAQACWETHNRALGSLGLSAFRNCARQRAGRSDANIPLCADPFPMAPQRAGKSPARERPSTDEKPLAMRRTPRKTAPPSRLGEGDNWGLSPASKWCIPPPPPSPRARRSAGAAASDRARVLLLAATDRLRRATARASGLWLTRVRLGEGGAYGGTHGEGGWLRVRPGGDDGLAANHFSSPPNLLPLPTPTGRPPVPALTPSPTHRPLPAPPPVAGSQRPRRRSPPRSPPSRHRRPPPPRPASPRPPFPATWPHFAPRHQRRSTP